MVRRDQLPDSAPAGTIVNAREWDCYWLRGLSDWYLIQPKSERNRCSCQDYICRHAWEGSDCKHLTHFRCWLSGCIPLFPGARLQDHSLLTGYSTCGWDGCGRPVPDSTALSSLKNHTVVLCAGHLRKLKCG